jgi:hypothetical protein
LNYRQSVESGLEVLGSGLGRYVDRRMRATSRSGKDWVRDFSRAHRMQQNGSIIDPSFLLTVIIDAWDQAFKSELPPMTRTWAREVRDVRNKWAHPDKDFTWTWDDAYRALDSIERLLSSVHDPEVAVVKQAKADLLREMVPPETPKAVPPVVPLPRRSGTEREKDSARRSPKYDALRVFLEERVEPAVHLSFAQIERILGFPLPASARRHNAWWANEKSGSHSHTYAWIGAGRRTANVNLNAETVDFVR